MLRKAIQTHIKGDLHMCTERQLPLRGGESSELSVKCHRSIGGVSK